MAPSAPKSRTRAIAAKPAATTTYPASPPTVSPDANSPALRPASALGEPFIDQSHLLLGHTQQQHLGNVFHGGSPPQLMSSAGAGSFMLAPTTQPLLAGGAASPAWSASSASLNGDIVVSAAAPLHAATYYSPSTGSSSGMLLDSAAQEWLAASCSAAGVSHEIMFPGLAHLPAAVPSSLATAAAAANDAAVLDGWLQQFVNAEAIEGVDRHPRALSMDSGGFLFGGETGDTLCPESLGVTDTPASLEVALGSPHSVHSSPLGVTACAAIDLLNESEVAAIASAAAGALSSDVLASMISSAASYCPPRENSSSASEMSMLAALPFTAITTTMASIAPQKTLAMSAASSEPPSKKQRRPSPTRKSLADAENGKEYPRMRNSGSSKGGVRNTAASTAPSASVNHSRPRPAGSSSASSSSVSPSPPPLVRAKAAAAAATRHMVPLAPRQASPSSENTASDAAKSKESAAREGAVAASGAQSSSSGSNTPPGLSVLAKIAQKQEPIQVKVEDSQPALRPIAQACSPQSRSKVANGTVAEALEKGDCSTLLAAAAAVVALPSTGETVAQKRQERLIKNRAAALLSRKRKRDYMTKLESEVEELRESNMSLARRLEEMELRLSALAAERDELRRENASAKVTAPQSSGHSSSSSASKKSEGDKTTSGEAAGNGGSEPSSSQTAEKPDDAMEVDGDGGSGQSALSLLGSDGISAKITRLATRTIKPRALLPAGAPKSRQPESQQQQGSNNKQRTTGALLMAVLFSFSLFTLPSLYTSDNQIAAGGSQSAGMLPIHALPPSAAEQRLLISDALEQQRDLPPGDAANGGEHAAVAGSPLLERVRRSISELAQQVDDAQAQSPGNSSGVASRMRPMTMEESAGLHAWIKHGLAAAATPDNAPAVGALEAAEVPAVSSLSVVSNSPRHVNRQLDYAMLFCPSMQHVLLGGDVEDVGAKYQPSAPRVIPAAERRTLDDVDDSVPPLTEQGFESSRVERRDVVAGSADLLVPTQAGERTSLLASQRPRPKMSLYSPIVAREGATDDDILAPWEEYAKVDTPVGGRQKYLRIDVEVVGSRWVTADKFAGGLY
ncbi:hypothetical protein GGH91_001166 [Coemansia sp. RSA 2671]|nr:hypothetical protein GGH91_001166 [Coemansia sp. RSA 2671]